MPCACNNALESFAVYTFLKVFIETANCKRGNDYIYRTPKKRKDPIQRAAVRSHNKKCYQKKLYIRNNNKKCFLSMFINRIIAALVNYRHSDELQLVAV